MDLFKRRKRRRPKRPKLCPHLDCRVIERIGTDRDSAWSCFGVNQCPRSCQFVGGRLTVHDDSPITERVLVREGREDAR